jgi:hypothetical protein
MRRIVLAFPLLALLALTAAAQDAVTITIAYPKPGQRSRVIIEDKTTSKTIFTLGGKDQTKDEVKMKSLVYIDEIIENPKNAKRATKLTRTYDKAVQTIDGNAKKLSVEGKTVLIEKKGEKYTFTVDGKPVADDARRLLSDEFDRPEGKDVRDIMFPKMAVKPGESWKIDGDEMAKAIGDKGPTFARDKVSATGSLVKTYKQDGKQFGVIEFVFDAPITSLGPKNPVTIKDGTMSMKLTGDGCIDGTASTGKSSTKMSLTMSGSTQGIDLKVAVENTENRTVEPLPKK